MMGKYARLAEELHLDMLCIGAEFVVATQSKFTARWKTLIADVRNSFSGRLVYAANWNGAGAYGVPIPEYLQVGFWSDLDYIGRSEERRVGKECRL